MERECRQLLQRFNLDVPPNRPVKWLRVGEQQLVEVAKALALKARLFILDEPTSALSESEIERLFAVIASLKAAGRDDDLHLAQAGRGFPHRRYRDRAARRPAYRHPPDQGDQASGELIRMMVGRTLTELFPKETVPAGEEVLRVEHLSLAPDRQRNTRSLA